MSRALKSPWYQFYDKEKAHLEYPDFSAYKLIEYTASKHLNNISYNYYGNKKTYHEFLKQIDDAARSFKALGVKHKDVVSICMPNTPEAIIAFYAINKIGAISSMIHPLSAENEIKNYLNISKTDYLLCIDFTMDKVNNIIDQTKVKKIITVGVAESFPIRVATIYNVFNRSNSNTIKRKIKIGLHLSELNLDDNKYNSIEANRNHVLYIRNKKNYIHSLNKNLFMKGIYEKESENENNKFNYIEKFENLKKRMNNLVSNLFDLLEKK